MKNLERSYRLVFIFLISVCLGHSSVFSQSYTDSLRQDEQDIIASIAPYSPEVRSTILDVAQYPQALVKIERVQARSSQSFQDLISGYSREEQEKFYEISRFPDILNQIVAKNRSSSTEIKPIIKDLPAATQTSMLDIYNAHYDDLLKMNAIYLSSQTALQKIMSSYPENVKNEFKKIIDMPDVMNLLTDNINLTVELGEAYKANPNDINQQLDSANNSITKQNTADLETYKKEVESNPELQDEMKKAATDFSSSNSQPDNPTYVTNNYYDNNPYPYWFSYPYWYTSPIWYPRPMHYYTGFYYGPGGRMVITGFPSHVYSNWFFGFGYRRYPNLYRHYGNYYNLHRTNIRNVNVYRGFNNASYRHFNGSNNFSGVRNRSTISNQSYGGQPHSRSSTNANWGAVRMSQMHPTNFNNRSFEHFHANSYHNMGWQHVGGAPHMSSTPHMSGGGSRMGGGGSRMGGGGGSRRGR